MTKKLPKFCLPKDIATKFKQKLKSGEIHPAELANMSSKGRRESFSSFMGKETAKETNALFERSLLSNQKKAMQKWVNRLIGVDDGVRKDMIKKIENMEGILTIENENQFLTDLVESKLGVDLTAKEGKVLFELTKKIEEYKGINTTKQLTEKLDELKVSSKEKTVIDKIKKQIIEKKLDKEKKRLKNLENRKTKTDSIEERSKIQEEIDLGVKKLREEAKTLKKLADSVDLDSTQKAEIKRLIDESVDLEVGAGRDYGIAKAALEKYKKDLIENGKSDITANPATWFKPVAGAMKSLKSTLDVSALLRQGLKTLTTHPSIWGKNVAKKVSGLWNMAVKGKSMTQAMQADIFARENYSNGLYNKLGIDIGDAEEAFPSTFPEKIPGFKYLHNLSNEAYTSFLYGLRADLADKYIRIAKDAGVDLTDKTQARSIGKLINSLTGRGHLGTFENAAQTLNVTMFSPKFLKSNIDTLTVHAFDKNFSSFARKQAGYNIMKIVGTMAVTLGIARLLLGKNAIEFDPRSSDFGKIKVGNTRFDISGGMGSLLTLASRIVTGSTKSGGQVKELGKDFGSRDAMDVIWDFMEGKGSPAFQLFKTGITRETYEGNPVQFNLETAGTLAEDAFVPLPISNYFELAQDPNSAPIWLAMLADSVGIGTNTYAPTRAKDWSTSESAEMTQFKEQVSEDEFKKANDDYNLRVNEKYMELLKNPEFNSLSIEEQREITDLAKKNIKQDIFEEYDFKFKRKKPEKTSQTIINLAK